MKIHPENTVPVNKTPKCRVFIKWIFIFPRLFFFHPYNESFKLKKCEAIFDALVILLLEIGATIQIYMNTQMAKTFGEYVVIVISTLVHFSSVMCMVHHLLRKSSLYRLVTRIVLMDRYLEKHSNYRVKRINRFVTTLVMNFVLTMFSGFWDTLISGSSVYIQCLQITVYINAFIIRINVYTFSALASLVAEHFDQMARNVYARPMDQDLVKTYHRSISSAAILNEIFGVRFLIIFTNDFVMIVASMYFVLLDMYNYKILVLSSLWVLHCSTEIFSLVHSCVNIFNKAEKFNQNIGNLIICQKRLDPVMIKQIDNHLLTKKKISFHACGFFTLDYALIHSIMAAVATYLVIMIQIHSYKD